MFGVYDDFPVGVHNIVDFTNIVSETRLQKALVEAFCKLNNKTLALEEVAYPSLRSCTAGFEFGVAEDKNFNYLDTCERDKLLAAIQKKPFSCLDFLCIVSYYQMKGEKRQPLKFDHYMLRFNFVQRAVQMQVFHEKGPMHVSHKDIPQFVAKIINDEFSKKVLKTIES